MTHTLAIEYDMLGQLPFHFICPNEVRSGRLADGWAMNLITQFLPGRPAALDRFRELAHDAECGTEHRGWMVPDRIVLVLGVVLGVGKAGSHNAAPI